MTPIEFFAGIRDGGLHVGGIRCLRLLRIEERYFAALQAEVARLVTNQRPSDVRMGDHVTNWTRPRGEVLQFSLLNGSGCCDDFSADHDQSCRNKAFHLGTTYPALAGFIEAFPHAVNFRTNLLGAGARLAAHEERAIIRTRAGSVGVCARFHLPILTRPGAQLLLDGQVFHLEAGVVYYVNHGCVHAARNRSDHTRLHLVWDLLLTRDAYDVVFGQRTPGWAERIDDIDRTPVPIAVERMGAHLQLERLVEDSLMEQIDWCQPQ